jgi:hypothetical protein
MQENKLYVVIEAPSKEKVEFDQYIVEIDMDKRAVSVDFPVEELDESYACFPNNAYTKDYIFSTLKDKETSDESLQPFISAGIRPSDIFLQAYRDNSIQQKVIAKAS